ncbi:hypothetical protein Efla_007320 [Eimeria flavescens]
MGPLFAKARDSKVTKQACSTGWTAMQAPRVISPATQTVVRAPGDERATASACAVLLSTDETMSRVVRKLVVRFHKKLNSGYSEVRGRTEPALPVVAP